MGSFRNPTCYRRLFESLLCCVPCHTCCVIQAVLPLSPSPPPPPDPPPPNHHHHSILWLTLVCFVTRLNYVVLRINGHISGRVCGYLSLMKTFLLNTERNLRRWLGPAHLLTQPGPKDNGESEVFQPGSPGGYSLSYPRLRWPHCLWLL